MKLAIISDIHANLEALKATLHAIAGQNAGRIVVLGDMVGYNANPSECIALLRQAGAICIAGNHERAVAGDISTESFSTRAALAVEWTRGQLSAEDLNFLANLPLDRSVGDHLIAVHGALFAHGGCELSRLDTEAHRRVSYEALKSHKSGIRVCAFGQTHRVGVFEWRDGMERVLTDEEIQLRKDSYYLVNPGTVGQPRQRDRRATYLTFDTARAILALHRVSYDFAAPVAKACEAGLLPFYARYPDWMRRPVRWTANALGLRGLAKLVLMVSQRGRRKATTPRRN